MADIRLPRPAQSTCRGGQTSDIRNTSLTRVRLKSGVWSLKSEKKKLYDLRPELSAHLRQRLEALGGGFRHNLALLGPAGSGKSVLLESVLRPCPSGPLTVHCHLQRGSLREFLRRFATAVLEAAVQPSRPLPYEVLIEQAGLAAPRTAQAVRQLERYETGHLSAEAFAHTLDLIPTLFHELQRPCVLVIDEFLFLEDLQLAHAFHELGKRVMTWPFALFLLTSSSPYRAKMILRERLHLLFGQFEVLSMPSVDPRAAMTWIRETCPSAIRMPSVAEFLLQWIGPSPWYLSVFLRRIQELARLSRAHRSEETIWLRAAWDLVGNPDGPLYHWCLTRVEQAVHQRAGVAARDVLLAMAHGARTSQAIVEKLGTRRNLSEALQVLVEHDLVERKGTCWIIPDQLLATWLLGVLGPRERYGSLDHTAAQRAFEQALTEEWAAWRTIMNRSLSQRLETLLNQFRNETVSLDSKTGRLPAFAALRTQRLDHADVTYLVADGEGRRWCCAVAESRPDENAITAFQAFCAAQQPKPVRKVVVTRLPMDLNAKLLAKACNMWVWESEDLNLLFLLYGQPPLRGG